MDCSIPIVVIDNASQDKTEQVVNRMKQSIRNLTYIRNDRNVGHDGNYRNLISIGKRISRYSLWLGDDDVICKKAFSRIPLFLREKNPQLILLNSTRYINNPIKRLGASIARKTTKKYYKYSRDIYIDNVEELFFECFDKMPFGCMIVDNNMFNIQGLDKYEGTYHLYSGAIWEGLCQFSSEHNRKINAWILSDPYIVRGKGKKTYSGQMDKVYFGIGKWYALLPEMIHNLARIACLSQANSCERKSYSETIKKGYESVTKDPDDVSTC